MYWIIFWNTDERGWDVTAQFDTYEQAEDAGNKIREWKNVDFSKGIWMVKPTALIPCADLIKKEK